MKWEKIRDGIWMKKTNEFDYDLVQLEEYDSDFGYFSVRSLSVNLRLWSSEEREQILKSVHAEDQDDVKPLILYIVSKQNQSFNCTNVSSYEFSDFSDVEEFLLETYGIQLK